MGKKKRPSGRRPKRPAKTPQQIAEESARRGVPEEQLQGPPARETLYLRSDAERQVEGHREEFTATSPRLSGGDVDANWERDADVGEEAVGGSVATPDQDVVDEMGKALGVPRAPDEEVRTSQEILEHRDRARWEQED